jgi:hypothetical protein
MLVAAASLSLHAVFISRNPIGLLPESILDVAANTGVTPSDVARVAQAQLALCEELEERIQLLPWRDDYRTLPLKITEADLGVVIPTLWWGAQPHNVVVTGFEGGQVIFNDPNAGPDRRMSEAEFEERWNDHRTDNDLLIVSHAAIALEGLLG